jgi:hypothetical protein
MGTIPPLNIPIGTSDPIDLCSGLPLFPAVGTARVGVSASSRSYKLFDTAILIVCTRLKISAYAGYGFGICGPSVAFLAKNVNLNRQNIENDGGQLNLTFNDGIRMEAGAFLGAYALGGLTLTLQVYLPRPWYKFWALSWQNAFTTEKNFKIDLLKLMFTLIQALLRKINTGSFFEQDTEDKLKETQLGVRSFYMVGRGGSDNSVRRNLTAVPGVTAPLNLANYVPELKAANLALAKVGGEISFGPSVHLQYPVTLNIDKFTVTGGLEGTATSADYGDVNYLGGNRISASGSARFNILQNPTTFATHVKYDTKVKLVISIHFKVKLAKFFNLEVNTPSLDLTYLLFRIREQDRSVERFVSTNVGGGCVLTPNMTLNFVGLAGPGAAIETGQRAEGTVVLAGFQSPSVATIGIEIEPPVANFPTSVTIPANSRSAAFSFTFQNLPVPTGNRNDPSETESPGPLSPLQSYLVRAKLTPPPAGSCTVYEVEAPLNITNRFIRCQRYDSFEGPAPSWDPLASATIKADIEGGAPSGSSRAQCYVTFNYVDGEPTRTVPVTFTLQNENREPYTRSDVEIVTSTGRKPLNPSCIFDITINRRTDIRTNSSFSIQWNSKGRNTGYSNRFYLILDAGVQFGQTEFWLDVYNWS